VTCNGSTKHPNGRPFLYPPFHGWTSLGSYFDHDLPDYVQDGEIVTATGLEAAPDPQHHASDFPAYWNAAVRQYLYYDGHNGYDFNLSYQPVYAAAAGKVIFAEYEYPDATDHGYGKMVMIEHRGGYVTLYGHFSKLLVKAGSRVRRGEQIGISGNTGHSTGPHLHFTVFHNCTPTDPYGWTGSGPDPLASYQGESATYLWIRPPDVVNPPPGWPGMDRLPVPHAERVLLLRLPATSGGTQDFTATLQSEALAVRTRLAGFGRVTPDLLSGAVMIQGRAPFARVYALSEVASIAAPDTLEGQKTDVLAALGRAALVTPHHGVPLGRSPLWSGYLLEWEGRTLLVGRGQKGRSVDLQLAPGKGGDVVKTLSADPSSGAYAIDLGALSAVQRRELDQTLHAVGHRGTTIRVHRVVPRPAPSRHTRGRTRSTASPIGVWILGSALALLCIALALATLNRQRILALVRR
jgi:hypothetical protein